MCIETNNVKLVEFIQSGLDFTKLIREFANPDNNKEYYQFIMDRIKNNDAFIFNCKWRACEGASFMPYRTAFTLCEDSKRQMLFDALSSTFNGYYGGGVYGEGEFIDAFTEASKGILRPLHEVGELECYNPKLFVDDNGFTDEEKDDIEDMCYRWDEFEKFIITTLVQWVTDGKVRDTYGYLAILTAEMNVEIAEAASAVSCKQFPATYRRAAIEMLVCKCLGATARNTDRTQLAKVVEALAGGNIAAKPKNMAAYKKPTQQAKKAAAELLQSIGIE